MLSVDEKYAFNLQLKQQIETQIQALKDFLRNLGDPTAKEYYEPYVESEIDRLNQVLKDQLHPIDPKEWGQTVSVRASDQAQQIAYGFCRLGGLINFVTGDQGEEGQFLHMVVTYAGHEIDRVTDLYLDGVQIPFGSDVDGDGRRLFGWATGEWENLVFMSAVNRGTDDQEVDPHLLSQSNILFPGKWTEAHRGRGQAHIYLILKYDGVKFLHGPPKIALEGQWKKIFDPRDEEQDAADPSTWAWSNNAVLCLYDYLCNRRFGPGFDAVTDFDETNVAEAADICDEAVSLAAGGTEARYTIDGTFYASRGYDHAKVISDMSNAMAGSLVPASGKLYFFPGAWREPVRTFTEANLRSALRIEARPNLGQIKNGVKGRYKGPLTNWELTDFPHVKNDFYMGQDDGERLWFEQDLPFTTSPSRCQRIAKIRLEEMRQWQHIEVDLDMTGFEVLPGENFTLQVGRLGIDKHYQLLDYAYKPRITGDGPTVTIGLFAKETAEGVFDWSNGEETQVDLAPNTTLPDGSFILPPANLVLASGTDELDIRSDGTVFARLRVSWDPTSDPFVLTGGQFEIHYKKSIEEIWRTAGFVSGTESSIWILDVHDGELYDVRVRSRTPVATSPWVEELGYFVLGKEENPSTPENFNAVASSLGIAFSWDLVDDLDVRHGGSYECRVGASFAEGTRIFRVDGQTDQAVWSTQEAGSYTFHLRAEDSSGNFSNSVIDSLEVFVPGAVFNLRGETIYNMVKLLWDPGQETSFPISTYHIYKGATFGSATLLGQADVTIFTFLEQVKGQYTYWVTAIDTHGNEGPARSITLNVDAPPLFELLYDQVLSYSTATELTNVAIDGGDAVGPVDTEQTYQDHFDDNTFTTPQDQITAGYPLYAQPALTDDAVIELKVDYGEAIAGALITILALPEWVSGSGTVETTLSYSPDDSAYTDVVGATQVFGVDFRYVKIRMVIQPDDDTSLVRIPPLRLRIDVKTEADSVLMEADEDDVSGTLVVWNKDFIDIFENSIQVTAVGNSPRVTGYTVTGNDVHVFLWDTSGVRVTGNVTVRCEGVITNS